MGATVLYTTLRKGDLLRKFKIDYVRAASLHSMAGEFQILIMKVQRVFGNHHAVIELYSTSLSTTLPLCF